MNTIPDYITQLQDIAEGWSKTAISVQASVALIDNALDTLLQKTKAVNIATGKLGHYAISISGENDISYQTAGVAGQLKHAKEEHEINQEQHSNFKNATNALKQTVVPVTETSSSVLEIADIFGNLSPELKMVKQCLKFFTNGIKAMDGLAGLAESAGGAMGIVDATELMTGVEALTAGSLAIPFIGEVAAPVILGIGTALSYALSEKPIPIAVNQDNFAQGAAKNGNTFITEAGNNTNAIHAIVQAKQDKLNKETPAQIARHVKAIERDLYKQGSNVTFDDDKAVKDNAYLQTFVKFLDNNALSKGRVKQVLFRDKRDMAEFQKRYDTARQFPLRAMPMINDERFTGTTLNPVDNTYVKPYMPNMALKNLAHIQAKPKPVIPPFLKDISILETVSNIYTSHNEKYVKEMYKNALALNHNAPFVKKHLDNLMLQFQQMKPKLDKLKATNSSPTQVGYTSSNSPNNNRQAENKTVVINLNKSMIENYTVNLKNTSDVLPDFRAKVEQIIIEVLHNANNR